MLRAVAAAAFLSLVVSADSHGSQRGADRILLFGGDNNRVYLGCFSCNELDRESVFNETGPYGSALSPTSIANRISEFGSKISPYSACNDVAPYPPVLVDESGTFYGELTVNRIRPQRVTASKVVAWLAAVCESA